MALKEYDAPVTSSQELRQKLLRSIAQNKNIVPCTEMLYAKVMLQPKEGASVEDMLKLMVPAIDIRVMVPGVGNGSTEIRKYQEEVEAFCSTLLKSIKELESDPELLNTFNERGIRKVTVTVTKNGAKSKVEVKTATVLVPEVKQEAQFKKKSAA